MRYVSSRGGVSGLTFQEALFSGYASDGGILLPEKIPTVSQKLLQEWASLPYVELAKQIVPMFIAEEEMPKQEISALLERAFAKFSHPDIAPIRRLSGGLNVMELFHGRTWAFKDLALSCVGEFLQYFLAKCRQHLTILTATSGDTGSAAIEAVRGLEWVDIIVLLPKGRCTDIQERQMTTVLDSNVHVYTADGTSDDLDLPVKRCFEDPDFMAKHKISSINSINWSRILIQLVHYFWAYLKTCPSCDSSVEIVVPTGGMGNITAGCIARAMGLPVTFVATVNTNDIVARTLTSGDFSMSPTVHKSLASAMDIQFAYNMERVWCVISGYNFPLVAKLMAEFEKNGKVQVPTDLLTKMQSVITTYVVNDEEIKATIRRCWEENQYKLCPHSATAVSYHFHRPSPPSHCCGRVCVACASPLKFPEALEAAGIEPATSPLVDQLKASPTRATHLSAQDDWLAILQKKVESIEASFLARKPQ